jgi:hypothetical protein
VKEKARVCELEGGDEGILFPENHTHPHPHAALWDCAHPEGNFHSKPCSLSLRSVATRGTEISVSVRVGEEMKNDKLITLKLMLQRRTYPHFVFYCPFWRNKKWPASRMPFSSSRTL